MQPYYQLIRLIDFSIIYNATGLNNIFSLLYMSNKKEFLFVKIHI